MATTKHKTAPKKRASPIEQFWLKQQFDQLHMEHATILKRINELKKLLLVNQDGLITPALESQVRQALALATKIDSQVPDKTLPPGQQQKKG